MDVNGILTERDRVAKEIWRLLNGFEKDTGMEVDGILLQKDVIKFGRKIVGGVDINLNLPASRCSVIGNYDPSGMFVPKRERV